jgi:hypothetical protein
MAFEGKELRGHVAFATREGCLHIHSLATYSADPLLFFRLREHVIEDARNLGYNEVRYYTQEPDFPMLKKSPDGSFKAPKRARIILVVIAEEI